MKAMKIKKIAMALCAALLCAPILPIHAGEDATQTADILDSEHAVVYDIDTKQYLLDKGSDEKMFPASLTKIMTAMVVFDQSPDLSEKVTIDDKMLAGLYEANASVVGWSVGETPTVEDLLYGTLLPSGADAVNALAYTFANSISDFVDKMNKKAQEYGMTNTHFSNPTGLHEEDHYSTCKDIVKLMEHALQNETFVKIFSQKTYTDSTGRVMEATIMPYITTEDISLPGFVGDKTGYTLESGHSMASYCEMNGMRLIVVTNHAMTDMYVPSHLYDTSKILTWLNDNYTRTTVMQAGDILDTFTAEEPVGSKEVNVKADTSLDLDIRTGADITFHTNVPNTVDVKNKKQAMRAEISILADGEEISVTSTSYTIPKSDDIFNMFLIFLRDLF